MKKKTDKYIKTRKGKRKQDYQGGKGQRKAKDSRQVYEKYLKRKMARKEKRRKGDRKGALNPFGNNTEQRVTKLLRSKRDRKGPRLELGDVKEGGQKNAEGKKNRKKIQRRGR